MANFLLLKDLCIVLELWNIDVQVKNYNDQNNCMHVRKRDCPAAVFHGGIRRSRAPKDNQVWVTIICMFRGNLNRNGSVTRPGVHLLNSELR